MTPSIDPETVKAGTTVTFRGRGWRPRGRIEAFYGVFCPNEPGTFCPDIGYFTRFRADRKGRFVFRFRYGSKKPRGGRGPVGAGGGEVTFTGPAPGGRQVQRHAAPPPPRSTRRQRAEARAVAGAVRALSRDIKRAVQRTIKATNVQQRDVDRCQDLVAIDDPPRREAVVERVVDASLDAATYGVDAAQFGAFADRLEAAKLTDPVLAAGAAAWIRAIRAPRYAPQPGLCAVLEAWEDTGFAPDKEPVDPATTGLDEDVEADADIRAAVKRLRDLGVRREAQELFGGDLLGLERYILA